MLKPISCGVPITSGIIKTNNMKKLMAVTCLLTLFLKGVAQDTLKSNNSGYFRFEYENDLFNQTDRYYTQGISAELSAPFVRYSPLSKILVLLNKPTSVFYGLKLKQDCFTPVTILYDTINRSDRPYCGLFYLSHFLNSINTKNKSKLTSTFDIGMIGPVAGCELEQKMIHRAVNSEQPLGWKNQLSNDVIINYVLNFEKGIIATENVLISAQTQFRAGTLYDDLSAGLHLRLGKMNSYFNGPGFINLNNKHQFQFFAYGTLNARLVGYNASLQGGVFTQSKSAMDAKNVERFIAIAKAGLVVSYNRVSLEYSNTYITKEFNSGKNHAWGSCVLMIYF